MIQHQLDARVGKMLQVLRELEVRRAMDVTGIETAMVTGTTAPLVKIDQTEGEFAPFVNGERWGVQGEWQDFRFTVKVPEDFSDMPVLHAVTGREGLWDATNPQFVVWVDGKVRQAFDVNHEELPLEAGKTYQILLKGYSQAAASRDENPPFLRLTLEDVNSQARALYYDMAVPYEAAMLLPEGNRDREVALEILARALDMLDLRAPHSPAFDASVQAAREYLKDEYYAHLPEKYPDAPVAECVGHTHIDVAWLWDLYQTRHKALRSFSTVLELMDRYPEYKFMSSQAQLYAFVKEDAPEVYQRIKARVAEGRWEPEGGMWVECDCNVTGGESLVRQFLYGQKFFTEEFGKPSTILWLPDVFGYSAALPQIMKLSGIRYFMTTKISWNEYNLVPYDTFNWKGIDGTEILTHFSPSRDFSDHGEGEGHEGLIHFTTYNALINPSQMKGGWQRYQQKGLDDHFLVSYGFGDGGGGPTAKMLEYARRMEKPMPGTPRVVQSQSRPFFEGLEKRVAEDPRLPKWSGELYLEYHRGTYTAIAKNKRNNRRAEQMLRETEMWRTVAARRLGMAYPQAELDAIWRKVLTEQFHDILPGSSIKKVYDDSDLIYKSVFEQLIPMKLEAMAALSAGAGDKVMAFDSLSGQGDGLVYAALGEDVNTVIDERGIRCPVQRLADGSSLFHAAHLNPVGMTMFTPSADATPSDGLTVTREGFETPFFTGKFDAAMRITSLVMKDGGREVAKAPLNRIVCYENRPHNYDAWDVNIYYNRRHWEVDDVQSVEMTESGPVRATLKVVYKYMASAITQLIHIYRDLPRVDFETTVDWKEPHYLLKAHFPVDVFYNEATCDVQFGNVKRATHKNTSWDMARFEVCAHKWVDVAEEGFGCAVLNNCKYGHSIDEDGVALTLLKSSTYPSVDGDQEMHFFTYSFMPHNGSWREAGVDDMARALNEPAAAMIGSGEAGKLPGPGESSFVQADQKNVVIDTVKMAQDGSGVIVRMFENHGKRTHAKITAGFAYRRVSVVNLLEQEIGEGSANVTLHPYEILTLKFE